MVKRILLVSLLALAAFTSYSRKVRVKHKIEAKTAAVEEMASDTLHGIFTPDSIGWDEMSGKIKFYGFDKTVNSSKESLFVVNGLDSCAMSGMTIEITYLDMKGRQLHRRNVELDCTVPPGETRRMDFPTWDTQKSFYFHKSSAPKKQATPFKVKVSLVSLLIENR